MPQIGFEKHDHDVCVASAMATAERLCAERKLQFTPVRRRVLEILLDEHKAMGAYDILARLTSEGLGSQPPIVYRALDFLATQGFVHKIEKMNAYVACSHPGEAHAPAFMICRSCAAVVETRAATSNPLGAAARAAGFAIESAVLEAEGLCPGCQTGPSGP